jgi:hypothetical protein
MFSLNILQVDTYAIESQDWLALPCGPGLVSMLLCSNQGCRLTTLSAWREGTRAGATFCALEYTSLLQGCQTQYWDILVAKSVRDCRGLRAAGNCTRSGRCGNGLGNTLSQGKGGAPVMVRNGPSSKAAIA